MGASRHQYPHWCAGYRRKKITVIDILQAWAIPHPQRGLGLVCCSVALRTCHPSAWVTAHHRRVSKPPRLSWLSCHLVCDAFAASDSSLRTRRAPGGCQYSGGFGQGCVLPVGSTRWEHPPCRPRSPIRNKAAYGCPGIKVGGRVPTLSKRINVAGPPASSL